MSDTSPYGVTQNADAARVTADELVGERAGSQRENAVFGSAATFSTAPYIPPYTNGRRTSRLGKCRGKDDTCMAYPVKGTDLCMFHSQDKAKP
jgi:hypothetical protein